MTNFITVGAAIAKLQNCLNNNIFEIAFYNDEYDSHMGIGEIFLDSYTDYETDTKTPAVVITRTHADFDNETTYSFETCAYPVKTLISQLQQFDASFEILVSSDDLFDNQYYPLDNMFSQYNNLISDYDYGEFE